VIRLLADHDFNERILEGLARREPTIDVLRVRDIGLSAAADPVILEWAAAERRVILTHDRQTMPGFVYARVAAGEPMPGVFLVDKRLPLGEAIDEILLAIHCLSPHECEDVIKYFPL
jgi:predicted nuclease of predicted toxin-antitoxin system